jgi:hypothetical protein
LEPQSVLSLNPELGTVFDPATLNLEPGTQNGELRTSGYERKKL